MSLRIDPNPVVVNARRALHHALVAYFEGRPKAIDAINQLYEMNTVRVRLKCSADTVSNGSHVETEPRSPTGPVPDDISGEEMDLEGFFLGDLDKEEAEEKRVKRTTTRHTAPSQGATSQHKARRATATDSDGQRETLTDNLEQIDLEYDLCTLEDEMLGFEEFDEFEELDGVTLEELCTGLC